MVSKYYSPLKPEFQNLVLDNDGVFFESLVITGFHIDVMDLISINAQLTKAFGVQPDQINKMPFWEFELWIKALEKLVKEENEQNKQEYERAGVDNAMKMTQPGYMNNMMSGAMKQMSMPNLNKMSMPSTIKMPNLKL